jgi:hypothetical protein
MKEYVEWNAQMSNELNGCVRRSCGNSNVGGSTTNCIM